MYFLYATIFFSSFKYDEEMYADNNNFVEDFGNEKLFMLPYTLKVCDFANNRLFKFHCGMPFFKH